MKLQRFELTESPHLTITCNADLNVDGGREGEVAIKVYGADEDLEVQREGDAIKITSRVRCKVTYPRDTTLTLKAVHGSARVRRVDNTVSAESLYGDATFTDVGPINIGHISGDLRLRDVNGSLQVDQASGDLRVLSVSGETQLGQVSGDLTIRGIKGALQCDNVSGDVSLRGVDGRVTCRSVSGDFYGAYLEGSLEATTFGDVSLKTDFTPGCEYVVTASGDTSVKFPENANASFQVTASGSIRHRHVAWAEIEEGPGSTLAGRVGNGEASVQITSSGDVSMRSKADVEDFIFSFEPEEDELDYELESMAEEIERNIEAHMARLNAQLEAELSRFDPGAVDRKAQQSAEKARRKAERAAERARINAERAQRRWERVGVQRPPRPTPRTLHSPSGKSDPVSEEERLMILNMVREGENLVQ